MMQQAFVNASIFTGESLLVDHTLYCCDGRIIDIRQGHPDDDFPGHITDLQGHRIVPGFIDIQVNGGGGILFNNDTSVEGIKTIIRAHQRFGTVALLPTLISDSHSKISQAIEAVSDVISQGCESVLGVHLEGPFLNAANKGAHDASYFSTLTMNHIDMLTALKKGITLVTLAPEQTEPIVIKLLSDEGVRVFAGHTSANYAQINEALAHGLTGFTHLFNAMTPLHSRNPGVVGAALGDKDSWCSIIVDNFHVHPASLAVALAAKQPGKILLITDAMASVGTDNKSFVLNDELITVSNGCCRNESGALAGSNLGMITAVRNTVETLGIDWQEAIRMASTYPAECLGVDDQYGYLKSGFKASFVVINDRLDIKSVWVEGANVFSDSKVQYHSTKVIYPD